MQETIREILKKGAKNNRFLLLDYGRYGLEVEKGKQSEHDEADQIVRFFISVPETSDLKDEKGREMADWYLAKCYKDQLCENMFNDIVKIKNEIVELNWLSEEVIRESILHSVRVQFKTRNEHWDKHKEEIRTLAIMMAMRAKEV